MTFNKLDKFYFGELLIFFFILRWIFIVGIGDWPDDITFGFFQKTDANIFEDYFFGYLNPINFYLLNFFSKISPLNDFFDTNLIIWILWIFNIYLTILILKKLNIQINFTSKLLIYLIFIAFYSPINTNFIFFNYLSSFLSSITLLFILSFLKNQKTYIIFLLSIICSLSILVKVNVGLSIFILTIVLFSIFSEKRIINSLILLILTLINTLIICFIVGNEDIYNILKIIFVSPSLEKGGLIMIFLRSLPRISFTFENQKYLKELFVSLLILYPIFIISFYKIINIKKLQNNSFNNHIYVNQKFLSLFFLIFILLLIISFFEIQNSQYLFQFILNLKLISLTEFNNHFLYSFLYILSFMLTINLILNNMNSFLLFKFLQTNMIILCLISFAFINLKSLGAGGRYSVTYSIQFFIILIFYLNQLGILKKTFFNYLSIFAIYYLLSWNVMPNQLSTFSKYYKLPNNEFPSVYLPYGSHSFIKKPHIGESKFFNTLSLMIDENIDKDKSFLWMGGGFPGFFDVKHYLPTLVPSSPPHLKSDIDLFTKNLKRNRPHYIALDTNKNNWDWDNKKRYNGEDLTYDNFFEWLNENYITLSYVNIDNYSLTIFELK